MRRGAVLCLALALYGFPCYAMQDNPAGLAPTLHLDFISGGNILDSRVTATVYDEGTYWNSSGTLTQATTNVARFNYNPSTLVLQGLLVEDLRTNLFLNSQSPATQDITTAASTYTLSFYGTGAIVLTGTTTDTLTGTGTTDLVQKTFSASAGTLTLTVSGTVTNVQLEKAANASTRIITAGSSVQRGRDQFLISSIPWFNANEGTLFVEFIDRRASTSGSVSGSLIYFSDNSSSDLVGISVRSSASGCSFDYKSAGTTDSVANVNTGTLGQVMRAAISWKAGANGILSSVNGSSNTASTATGLPTITQLSIGYQYTGTSIAINTSAIRIVNYWNTALTQAQLNMVTK